MKKHSKSASDAAFFADSAANSPSGSHKTVAYDDRLAISAEALAAAAAPAGDDRYRPAVTLVLLLLQVMQHDRDFPRVFVRRLHTALSLAGSSYVQELLLLALAGQPLPGPLELAERHGITKQAVSREILDAIARIRAEEPRLAELLEAARVQYHASDPAGSIAPHPREKEYPVPASACDGHTVIEVDFGGEAGRKPATMKRNGDLLVFTTRDGAEVSSQRGKASLVVVETDRGTVVSAPYVRVSA